MASIHTAMEEGVVPPLSFAHRRVICVPKRLMAMHILLARITSVLMPPSNIAVKIAPFGRWTAQKRAAFYLDRSAPCSTFLDNMH